MCVECPFIQPSRIGIDRTLLSSCGKSHYGAPGVSRRADHVHHDGLHRRRESPNPGAGGAAGRRRGCLHLRLARGMSLNAYFTYVVCQSMHVPWRTALGVIFFSGVFFLILTVTRVREQIVNGIPECLKYSTAGGIGMFIAFVGLRNAKLVVANPATFVGLGSFADHEAQLACIGLAIMLVLMTRKINGAILIGIFATTVLGILRGIT